MTVRIDMPWRERRRAAARCRLYDVGASPKKARTGFTVFLQSRDGPFIFNALAETGLSNTFDKSTYEDVAPAPARFLNAGPPQVA